MTETVVAFRALHFAYGTQEVLRGIELTVAGGEIFGLVGADGAGKSTLLRIATGQLEPDSGAVEVLGQPATEPALRDDIAYMPQGFGLYPDLSVWENLQFFADLHGLPRAAALQRGHELLERTGLAGFEQRRARDLSGGMMQKLALACALVSEPRVMFLDEPTTGVDPLTRRSFWRLLTGVRAAGVAILYATANMDEAERCDRLALLQGGRVSQQGTPEALARTGTMALFAVYGPDVRGFRAQLTGLPGVRLVFPVGPRLNVWLDDAATVGAFRAALVRLSPQLQAQPLDPTLHDVALRDLAQREASADGAG